MRYTDYGSYSRLGNGNAQKFNLEYKMVSLSYTSPFHD